MGKRALLFMHPLSCKPEDCGGGMIVRRKLNPGGFTDTTAWRDSKELQRMHPLYEERIKGAIESGNGGFDKKIIFADAKTPDFSGKEADVIRTESGDPWPLMGMLGFLLWLRKEGITELVLVGEKYIDEGKKKFGCLGAFEKSLKWAFWIKKTVDRKMVFPDMKE